MLLIYGKTDFEWTGSAADVAVVRELLEFEREIQETGELISAEALDYPSEATLVSVRDGVPVVTDGPFAESKEYLAGYFLIECASPDRAVEIAKRMPTARTLAVELRPVIGRAQMRELARGRNTSRPWETFPSQPEPQ